MDREPSIQLLGTPALFAPASGGFFPSKGFQLLSMLCLAPSQRITRKEAAALLWDSASDAAALTNLRQLIARLKRSAPGLRPLIETDANSITLGEGKTDIDLFRFEVAIRGRNTANCIEAAFLVRGELLAGIDDVSDQFSHWLIRERGALRERFFTAASAALIELTKFGRATEGDLNRIAERMLLLEPEREQTYRVLVEAYGRNGMYEDARRIYRTLTTMLSCEYGTQPSSETAAVARRVFAGRSNYASPVDLPADASRNPRVAFLAPVLVSGERQPGLLRYFIEDVANELTRYRSFVVLAPHSSFRISHDFGLPADNARLQIDYAISGFVKPDRDGRVLALRMTRCETAEMVWAAEFAIDESELARSFSLMSLRVASSLSSAIERDRLAHRKVASAAYLSYLDGQRSLDICDLVHLRRARNHFRRSVDASPRFAPPRARIAQTLYLEWIQTGGRDPELLNVAREQAEIAYTLDPHDATGQWMKGTVALYQRDFDECEAALAEAETLAPNSADLQVQFGDALSHLGRPDEGWTKFERALELNPVPPEHYWWAGASIAFHQQDFRRAIELCDKLADDEPVLPLLAASHAWLGELAQAREYGQRIKDLFPGRTALEKSMTVTPDKDPAHRNLSVEGLRMAGVF